jgi:four helix bundle protein
MKAETFRDLLAYQKAFELQQAIFELSKSFPAEEKYSLTDQIRRSSRSVGGNIAEAWRKRRYPAHFVSKLTDADGENAEMQHWLDTARACGYVDEVRRKQLLGLSEESGRLIGKMIQDADRWCGVAQ